jgi:G3E family GTPase
MYRLAAFCYASRMSEFDDTVAPGSPLPVTILCGFLGAGKTTLLNWLLRAPHGMKIAVIVNEFGRVGVDGTLVQGGEQFVELDNGCLCCALNADLDRTIRELLDRGGFDRIVVETTGLADPLPVAWSFTRPGLSQRLRVDAIVSVADAASLERALGESEEAAMQLRRADIIVLNKLDLVKDGGRAATERIRTLNASAPILPAVNAEAPAEFLFDGENLRERDAAGPNAAAHNAPAGPRHHAHHTAFETFTWQSPAGAQLDDRQVEDFVYDVPTEIYRFKGLVRTNSDWGPWTLINAVAGRIDLRPVTPRVAPEQSYVVFIGRDLQRDALQALCDALLVR